ncbi:hypothetical protein PlfCFBP13513_03380 [Plantibacter flavus]|nr:hypothetical protein PlfCFBP13513_03380 [Plantibacter flavus]
MFGCGTRKVHCPSNVTYKYCRNKQTYIHQCCLRTIQSTEAKINDHSYGVLDLRYSPSCHSNWVRFTPWGGFRSVLSLKAGGAFFGSPWIWRQGVADSLRGVAGQGPWENDTQTTWTAMVTADGITCLSVSLFYKENSTSGQGDYHDLGPYNAPCASKSLSISGWRWSARNTIPCERL